MSLEYDELSKIIIGCAYKVYNTLGSGFAESVYENSLVIELKKSGLNGVQQAHLPVYYEEYKVGDFKADIIVENKFIIELKAIRELSKANEVQLVNYLTATKIDNGLLINFGEDGVEVKRKFREFNKNKNNPVNPV